jgi:hypothetical protein
LRPWALLEPQHGQFSFVLISVQQRGFLAGQFLRIVREQRVPVRLVVRWA